MRSRPEPYTSVSFVHITGHADEDGIGLLGDDASWEEVAALLGRLVAPVEEGHKRVLCISTCRSAFGLDRIRVAEPDLFTGCYHMGRRRVPFSSAAAVWSMFYLTRKVANPSAAIIEPVNDFLRSAKVKARLHYQSW